jgi:hypothetical protein
VLICSEKRVLLADYWFVLREKYCWLVADKPNEQAISRVAHCLLRCLSYSVESIELHNTTFLILRIAY